MEGRAYIPVLALRLTALAAPAISVSGYVMRVYGSHARSDTQSQIGLPIQDVVERFDESECVTGDAARRRYVREEYESYDHDYDYTYYEQDRGSTPNSSVLNQKIGMANQNGYYACIYGFFADASGGVIDATARNKCRWFQAPFTPQRAIGSANHRLVSDVAGTPESNVKTSPPLVPP